MIYIAWDGETGFFWDGHEFCTNADYARFLTAKQLFTLLHTYPDVRYDEL